MTKDIFSVADIQRLIEAFPPPDPRPGKECLVRSRSGKNLIRSETIIKRFNALLDSSSTQLLVSNLPGDLGVQDVRWLLEGRQQDLFFTRDRLRILPKLRQREIAEAVRVVSKDHGIRIPEWADKYDISTDTLVRMTSQDPSLLFVTLSNGLAYREMLLEDVSSSLLHLLLNSGDVPLNITDQTRRRLPDDYLEETCKQIIIENSSTLQGSLEPRSDGIHFVPQSALTQLQSEKEQAKKDYINQALRALSQDGYHDLSVNRRPTLLQDIDLADEVQIAYQQDQSLQAVALMQVQSEAQLFLIRKDILSKKQDELARSADQLAEDLWRNRVPGQDVLYVQEIFVNALAVEYADASPNAISFETALVRSQHAETARAAFESKVNQLQEFTSQRFAELIRTKLLAPLILYTKGVESINDTALQPRVLEFVTDWARRTLVQEILLVIKNDKLVVTKLAAREVDKFAEAVQAAKTLSDVNTAASKLARKQKIDQPDTTVLAERKGSIIQEKVAWMKRSKRSSDLLQNLNWVLLASTTEGLFMSSGKDTSRMIKLYQAHGDADIGKRLGELRDIVKGGNETDKEKAEMRELARAAVEALTISQRAS